MSNIINKVKDAMSGDHHHTTATTGATGTTGTTGNTYTTGTTGTAEGVAGPHSSRLANTLDPRVDSDLDGSRRVGTTTGTTGTTGMTGSNYATGTTGTTGMTGNNYATGTTGTTAGTAEGVAGPHSSRLANALDPRVDSDMDGSRRVGTTAGTTGVTGGNNYATGTTGTAEGMVGPHSSRLANTLDPRVDSDMDGSRRVGTTAGTTGVAGGNNYATGATGTAEGMVGPHSSRLANALDPRVDSDMDGSTRVGGTTAGTTGVTGRNTYTTGATGTTGKASTTGGLGPHSSSLLNKLDPRVDSTTGAMKTSGTTGATGMTGTAGTYTTGTTGGLSNSTNAGPHDSNLANKLDPRVDSDLDGRGNRHGAATGGIFGASGSHATPGRGTAQNTAGPHNSDLANKLDPRVDSDMDGSGTVGVNRTYAGTGSKDPHDAAHVPPSVLRESLGDPVITHDNPEHNHQGRHGSMSHQEAHLHRGPETY